LDADASYDIVRIIAFCWIALLLVCPRVDAAPQLICINAQPGDTAAALASRLTNESGNQHQQWFQIFNPATAHWIAKTDYGRLEPGWRACVPAVKFNQQRSAGIGGAGGQLATIIRKMGWWWFPFVMSATALAWVIFDGFDDRRRKMSQALESFGTTFVQEFERPLLEPSTKESPVRSRLNVLPHRRRLEVLLAPGDGRRYPNLSDHRRNLEYDVDRVITALADKRFVLGDLATQGPWVVIPFRLDAPLRKAGWS
jgi:hypothetical protein